MAKAARQARFIGNTFLGGKWLREALKSLEKP